jgi:hypothetical protein
MPKTTVVRRLQRVTDHDGRTLHFMIGSSDRRHPPQFIPCDQVPAFEGPDAWFELEKIQAKPWPFWKVLRRVEAPMAAPLSR